MPIIKIVSNTTKDWLMPHLGQNMESQTRSKVLAHWSWSNIRLKWPNILPQYIDMTSMAMIVGVAVVTWTRIAKPHFNFMFKKC